MVIGEIQQVLHAKRWCELPGNDRSIFRSYTKRNQRPHIAQDGIVTIANAGHLSPYLDGREVALPGALPLGVESGGQYEATNFQLLPGSRLTFLSDGVVEAQSQQGELFGFERARAISVQPAAAIAATAAQFGQSDDITVVTIKRIEESAAPAATEKQHMTAPG